MDEPRLPLGKCCTKCGGWKLFAEFHRDRKKLDGRSARCAECKCAYQREYNKATASRRAQYARAHREEINAYKRRWRAQRKHSAAAEKDRETKRRWSAHWRQNPANRAYLNALIADWRRRNPDKVQAQKRRRYAAVMGAEGEFTELEWRELCDTFGNRCLSCSAVGALEVDHIVPLSKGGANTIDNVQPLCRVCNASKGARIIDYR